MARTSQRRLTVALVLLVTVVATEAMAVATILPIIRAELGGLSWYGWVFAAFSLAQIVAIPLTGQWVDRMNPALPLVGGVASFAAGLVVGTVAPSMPILVLGRVLQGFGAGVVPAVAYVCVGRGYAEDDRPRVFAFMSTAWVVPALASPALASVVAEHLGWRWVFGGLVPFTIVAAALAVPAVSRLGSVPPVPSLELPASQTVPSLVLAIGATALIAGFNLREVVAAVAVSLAGLVVTGIAFRRLTPIGTGRLAPGLPAAVGLRGVMTLSFFAADAYVSLTVTAVRHTGTIYAGVALAAGTMTWTAGSWLQARVVQRVGPRVLARVGFAIVAAGSALMWSVAATDVPTWVAVVAWAVAGLGIGMSYAVFGLVVLSSAEPGREGFSTAALQLSDALGIAVGTGLGGVVVATATRWGRPISDGLAVVFSASVVVALLGAVGAARLPGPRRPVDSPVTALSS